MSGFTDFLVQRYPPGYACHLGELLDAYESSGSASPNFKADVLSSDDDGFLARVWEAMLYRHFLSLGFEFTASLKKGPDFGIKHQGQTIWIEAVTPAPIDIPADYLAPPSKGAIVEFKKRPD